MSVQSVERAVAILDYLSRRPTGVPLNEIAQAASLHASTCFRILKTLKNQGLVEQLAEGGSYRPGPGLLILASRLLLQVDLVSLGVPHVNALCSETEESVHLCVLMQGEAREIAARESDQPVRAAAGVGTRMPLHSTAVGKVLLAFQASAEERERLLDSIVLQRHTAHTVTDPQRLKREVEQIRQQGFALNDREFHVGTAAVAAPVLNFMGDVVASLGIALPDVRFSGPARSRLIDATRRHAYELSRELGYSLAEDEVPPVRSSEEARSADAR